MHDYLTPEQAAPLIRNRNGTEGVTPDAVRRYCRLKLLRAERPGRDYLIRRSDVVKFVPPPNGRRPKKKLVGKNGK